MSAGTFTRSRYSSSITGLIHPIRVQPETLDLALTSSPSTTNAGATSAISNPISADVSRSNRGLGLRPRKATFEILGTPPTGYSSSSVVTLPILNETLFGALTVGTSVNYLGTTWQVISTSPESAR